MYAHARPRNCGERAPSSRAVSGVVVVCATTPMAAAGNYGRGAGNVRESFGVIEVMAGAAMRVTAAMTTPIAPTKASAGSTIMIVTTITIGTHILLEVKPF